MMLPKLEDINALKGQVASSIENKTVPGSILKSELGARLRELSDLILNMSNDVTGKRLIQISSTDALGSLNQDHAGFVMVPLVGTFQYKAEGVPDGESTFAALESGVWQLSDPPFPATLELTYDEAVAAAASGDLVIGAGYKITGVHEDLYGGTDIFLKAIAPNLFSIDGHGIFWNPVYDQSLDMGTGTYFKKKNGIWFAEEVYAVNDRAIWGGRVWRNKTGTNTTAPLDKFTLDPAEWDLLPFSAANGYAKVVDFIMFDFDANLIHCRIDNKRNEIHSSINYEVIFPDPEMPEYFEILKSSDNNIKNFAWGIDFDPAGVSGITDNYCEAGSTLECLNGWPYVRFNSVTNGAVISGNDLHFGLLNNRLIGGKIADNIGELGIANNHIQSSADISSGLGVIAGNTTTIVPGESQANITANSLMDGVIENCTLGDNCVISNNDLKGSLSGCTLNNDTLIQNSELSRNTILQSVVFGKTVAGAFFPGQLVRAKFEDMVLTGVDLYGSYYPPVFDASATQITASFILNLSNAPGNGAIGELVIPFIPIKKGWIIERVYIDKIANLTSAGSGKILMGIKTDDPTSVLNVTNGLFSAINSAGTQLITPAIAKATATRSLAMAIQDAAITGGQLNITVVLRNLSGDRGL